MVISTLEIDKLLPATFTAPGLSEAEFLDICARIPDFTVEYSADGTITMMPLSDLETSARVAEIICQLSNWTRENSNGHSVGPDVSFRLLDGARRSPDAAWFDDERWQKAKTPGTRFPTFAPDFVIELRSPDDRLPALREKMNEYIANGVQLAWLIDPSERTVTIYHPADALGVIANPTSVAGEGPIADFVLVMERIFS